MMSIGEVRVRCAREALRTWESRTAYRGRSAGGKRPRRRGDRKATTAQLKDEEGRAMKEGGRSAG